MKNTLACETADSIVPLHGGGMAAFLQTIGQLLCF
jgi:hypothetical protein